MDVDILDALSMLPGLVGSHYLAYMSDDFVYRIAVLSWGWTCLCSMVYHLSNCDPKLLKYDLRSQWVSQVFMVLETPQYSWPIVIGGLMPVGDKGRAFLNGLGGFYFLSHSRVSMIFLTLSYIAYFLQFKTKIRWAHSVFHILLHCAGGSLIPYKKYTLPIDPVWAWGVFWVGAWILLPNWKRPPKHLRQPARSSFKFIE
jgi:hypothetical protein